MSKLRTFVGTYTKKEGHVEGKADGVYSCLFDSASGELKVTHDAVPSINPSYLAVSPDGLTLYAANEMFEDLCDPHATLSAFRIGGETMLKKLNEVSSNGIAPCYVTTDRAGRFLYGVNYKSGSVFVVPLGEEGLLRDVMQLIQHEGSGPTSDQDGPHAHSIYLDSNEQHAVVPDKGADQVFVYSIRESNGKLVKVSSLRLPEGAGPRHFAFHPSGQWGYVLNEINSTITSCLWKDGRLVPFETTTTLPSDFDGRNSTADIHISPDGRFLYASNRGHDSLAAFHVDLTMGGLVLIGFFPAQGRVPRGFVIDPSGKWLLCANQN